MKNNENNDEETPRPDEVAKLLSQENYDTYSWFCLHFLKSVVGYDKWEKNFTKVKLSDFVMPSDEAFALLVYENNHDRWLDMYERQDYKTSEVENKWTNSGNNRNSGGHVKRFNGWSVEAYKRFNDLSTSIKKNRSIRKELEIKMMTSWIDGFGKTGKKRKANSFYNEQQEVFPENDLPFHSLNNCFSTKLNEETESESDDESSIEQMESV